MVWLFVCRYVTAFHPNGTFKKKKIIKKSSRRPSSDPASSSPHRLAALLCLPLYIMFPPTNSWELICLYITLHYPCRLRFTALSKQSWDGERRSKERREHLFQRHRTRLKHSNQDWAGAVSVQKHTQLEQKLTPVLWLNLKYLYI